MILLEIHEDNAGGLTIYRPADNTLFCEAQAIARYYTQGPLKGELLSKEETEFWLKECTVNQWGQIHPSEGGEKFVNPTLETRMSIGKFIATYDGQEWTLYPESMGTNGRIACGYCEGN
jgi:hypothetical protein